MNTSMLHGPFITPVELFCFVHVAEVINGRIVCAQLTTIYIYL